MRAPEGSGKTIKPSTTQSRMAAHPPAMGKRQRERAQNPYDDPMGTPKPPLKPAALPQRNYEDERPNVFHLALLFFTSLKRIETESCAFRQLDRGTA
jgi:hypothetical protein